MSSYHVQACGRIGGADERWRLLANEEHVYGAQVEVVVEGERGETVIRGVLAGVELRWDPCEPREIVMRRGSRGAGVLTITVLPLYWTM